MHGYIASLHRTHKFSHKKRHAAATWRAFTGARLYLGLPVKPDTYADAATMVASSPTYIQAAIAVIQSEDAKLKADIILGNISLLAAAKKISKRAKLVQAYRDAGPEDRVALGRVEGVANIWDEVIVPSV
jgi:hypothetical protein